MGHIQCERFTFENVHVLYFRNGLKEVLLLYRPLTITRSLGKRWLEILVANLATNFQDLVAKVKILVALAPVFYALIPPGYLGNCLMSSWPNSDPPKQNLNAHLRVMQRPKVIQCVWLLRASRVLISFHALNMYLTVFHWQAHLIGDCELKRLVNLSWNWINPSTKAKRKQLR